MMRTTIALLLLSSGVSAAEEIRRDLYGDPLPAGAVMRLGTVRFRHGGQTVMGVAYSPDGKLLATCGGDHLIRLWDSQTGQELLRFDCLSPDTISLIFSPDGKLLASGNLGFTFCLWDVATGKLLHAIKDAGGVRSLVFSCDGKNVVSGSTDKRIRLWDVATGKCLRTLEGHKDGVIHLSMSADGKWLASGGYFDGMICVWDMATGKRVRKWIQQKDQIYDVRFAPDGKTVATGGKDGSIHLWEVATGKARRQWKGHGGEIGALLFTPDGRKIFSGDGEGIIREWDATTGEEVRVLARHLDEFDWMSLSADGKTLASVSWDKVVRRWNLASGKKVSSPRGHEAAVSFVRFADNDKTLLSTAEDGTARIWDATTGKEIRCEGEEWASDEFPDQAALAMDNHLLAAATQNTVRLWNRITGKTLASLPITDVRLLRVSPDGNILAAGTGDDIIHLWDVRAGKERWQREASRPLVFSADSRFLAAPDVRWLEHNGGIHLWESVSGKEVCYIPCPDKNSYLYPRCFSADGRMLVGCHLTTEKNTPQRSALVVWEAATGRERLRWRTEGSKIFAAAFSPDGATLAVGGVEQTIQMWDLRTGVERPRLRGDQGDIGALAFSKDGRWLASGGENTTILLWPVTAPPGPARSVRELSTKELQARWIDLLGQDAACAFKAMQTLHGSPASTVVFLRKRLRPVTAPDADAVQRLLDDLDGDDFAVRERATKELEKLVDAVEPLLRQALKDKPPLERRVRVKRLLEMLAADSPEHLRASRALEVLEWLNTAETRRLLRHLASGVPTAWLTREAKAASSRLDRRAKSEP